SPSIEMKSSAWLLAPSLLCGAALGFIAGRARPAPPPVIPVAAPARAAFAVDEAAVRADIRRILAAECRRRAGVEAVAPPALAPSPLLDRRSAGDPEALDRAHALLAHAVEAGAWTESDAGELRTLMPRLSEEEQAEVRQALFVAINDGRLRPEWGARLPL